MINTFPPCWRLAAHLRHKNNMEQGGRTCRGPRKHGVGPRLCHAAYLYLRACLKGPTLTRIQRIVFVFSARQQQKWGFWGKTGGKHNLFFFFLWFYFAPAEHCRGANCRLLCRPATMKQTRCGLSSFVKLFCEFYFHRDTFISVRYHKGSGKPIQTFVFTPLMSTSSSSELLRPNYRSCCMNGNRIQRNLITLISVNSNIIRVIIKNMAIPFQEISNSPLLFV